MDDPASSETLPPAVLRSGPARHAARMAFRWVRAATETRSLVVLAILVRLVAAWSSPAILNDSVSLLRGAERLMTEGPVALLDVPHHPLPLILYAALGRLLDLELAAVVLGALGSGLAVWPLHSLARRACGRHAATATCILYVALPKAVAVGAVPLAEGPFLPLFLGSLALAAGTRDAGKRVDHRLLGAGLLAGLSYLCRPEGLIAFPAVLAAATLDSRAGRPRRGAIAALGFVMMAAPYVALLSAQRDALTISPKKDVVRFVGAALPRVGVPQRPAPIAAPERATPPASALDVAKGVSSALDSALTVPVAALVGLGLLGWKRWKRKRARRPRLLLVGSACVLLALVARLQAGWGYSGGRHALAAATLLLPFAGQGLMTLAGVLPRMTSRRRFVIATSILLAIPLAARAVLRPPGEGGVPARALGAALARHASPGAHLRVASVAEPLVAYYAHRSLRDAGGSAVDVPVWGRFVRPIEDGASVDAVGDALAAMLRADADWLVVDVTPPTAGAASPISRDLADGLRARGVLGVPAVSVGGNLSAYPVAR